MRSNFHSRSDFYRSRALLPGVCSRGHSENWTLCACFVGGSDFYLSTMLGQQSPRLGWETNQVMRVRLCKEIRAPWFSINRASAEHRFAEKSCSRKYFFPEIWGLGKNKESLNHMDGVKERDFAEPTLRECWRPDGMGRHWKRRANVIL